MIICMCQDLSLESYMVFQRYTSPFYHLDLSCQPSILPLIIWQNFWCLSLSLVLVIIFLFMIPFIFLKSLKTFLLVLIKHIWPVLMLRVSSPTSRLLKLAILSLTNFFRLLIILFSDWISLSFVNFSNLLSTMYCFCLMVIYISNWTVCLWVPLWAPLLLTPSCFFHESKWLNDCPESFKPILYMRYIDDCFLLFKEQSHSFLFLNYLNSKHNNINFSMETELSGSFPFLDILVSRSSNGFSTSLYRKPSSTLSGMNFFSFAPFSFKLSAIRCRVHRAFHLCSDWFSFHNKMSYLRTFFRFNLFPDHLLNTCINRFLSKLYRPQPLILTVPQLNLYLTIPYLGPLSLSLSSELRCLFSKYFPHCKIPLLHTNSHI